MDRDEKQQLQINLQDVNKSEALHLMTKLTEMADRVVRFNLTYPVEGYDTWMTATRRIRTSLFTAVETIEIDQAQQRGEQE